MGYKTIDPCYNSGYSKQQGARYGLQGTEHCGHDA